MHQLERVPFLSALETRVRHGLAELFSFEILGADATLFSQGDVGERFYILMHGTLEVVANDEVIAT